MTVPFALFAGDSAWVGALYILSFSLFIFGIRLGTHPTTARRGNLTAALGMAIAVATTLAMKGIGNWHIIIAGIVVGSVIGVVASKRVKMTAMPQMVAIYNGVGGGAIALIAWAEYRHWITANIDVSLEVLIPTLLAMVIGSISFWGSNVAFAKLQELVDGKPLVIPGQKFLNLLLVAAIVAGCTYLSVADEPNQTVFIGLLVLAAILANLIVFPIGGADMPVVIALLNAATGISAAAAGVALDNTALMVGGTLVGSSGTILTLAMARAMNRSVANILFAGFGGAPEGGTGVAEDRPVRSMNAQDAAIQLAYADSVVVVPGYGLAVAQAQHTVREVADDLQSKGVSVNFAIHPVAGRMPGHMNVLLAEADVPYEQLKEMDEINPELPQTDVVVVIGANDVVNPAAKTDEGSPIYGMPIIEVTEAQQVLVLKRSMGAGFAGIENELFFDPKTSMVFGDAKQTLTEIVAELGNL